MATDKRKTPEFSASSMADIAFLLLIFFLMVTTMNVDSGIQRVLPPMPDKEEKPVDVKMRNILRVNINRYDQIQVNDELMDIRAIKDKVKEFMLNPYNDENLPEKEEIDIPLLGKYEVTKGVVSLQNDRGTSYNAYIAVQNELTRALNEIRDEVAQQHFGKKLAELADEERDAILKAVPTKISEAEPRNIEGGR